MPSSPINAPCYSQKRFPYPPRVGKSSITAIKPTQLPPLIAGQGFIISQVGAIKHWWKAFHAPMYKHSYIWVAEAVTNIYILHIYATRTLGGKYLEYLEEGYAL